MNWLAKFINFFTENSFSIIDLWFIFHISSAIEASNWADVVVAMVLWFVVKFGLRILQAALEEGANK